MTKEEARLSVMGAISMALKDTILQQGFEIICKENAELKNKIEHRNCLDCSNHHSNIKLLKAKEIIALGLRVCETSSIEYMNLYQKQAEQFIKEIEK